MMAARRVTVSGHVQGVFFRAWTKGEAEALGVTGWVCNRADGTVEAHLEGEPAALDALEARMREGPDQARVDSLRSVAAQATGERTFAVRR